MAEPGFGLIGSTIEQDEPGFAENFIRSALSAGTGELIGGEPPSQVERFRAENTAAGVTSQIFGSLPYFVIPELIPLRMLKSVPAIGRFAKMAEANALSRPFAAEAAAQTARFAPFELGRIGLAEAMNDAGGETAQEAVINIGLAAGIGGAARKFWAGRPGPTAHTALPPSAPLRDRMMRAEQEFQSIAPQYDPGAPAQARLRMALGLEKQVPPSFKEERGGWAEMVGGLKRQVKEERPPEGRNEILRRLVLKSAEDNEQRNAQRALNRLMTTKPGKGRKSIRVSRLVRGKQDFLKNAQVQGIINRSGLGQIKDWEQAIQFPRHIKPAGEKAGREVEKTLDRNMVRIPSKGLWIQQEQEGLYVVAKKIGGKPGEYGPLDDYLLFKTDEPELFAEDFAGFGRVLDENVFRIEKALKHSEPRQKLRESIPAAKLAQKLHRGMEAQPLTRYENQTDEYIQGILGKIFPEKQAAQMAHEIRGSLDLIRRKFKRFASPALNEVNHSPRAMRIMALMRAVFDFEDARGLEAIYGKALPKQHATLYGDLIRSLGRDSRFQDALREMSEESLPDVQNAMLNMMSPDEAAAAGFADDAVRFLRELDALDGLESSHVVRVEELVDHRKFTPLKNHFLVSRSFTGDRRIPLFDGKNRLVAMAHGNSNREVLGMARKMQEIGKEQGQTLSFTRKDMFLSDPAQDIAFLQQQLLRSDFFQTQKAFMRRVMEPARFKPRKGVAGSDIETKKYTKKDILDAVGGNIRQNRRYTANLILRDQAAADLDRLKIEDPITYRRVASRIEAFSGQKSPFNALVEKSIAGNVGFNPQKVTRLANETMYHLSLGMGDVGFAALNASTFLQTSLAEAAFLLRAPTRATARFYQSAFVGAPNGLIQEVRLFEPMRLAKEAFRQMARPDARTRRLFDEAAARGYTVPRLAEEVLGEKSRLGQTMKGVWSGDVGIFEGLKDLSSWLPSKSEELARSHTFMMGKILGEKFYGIKNEELLFQFAANFTDRSMYRYGVQDRAAITTGAVGGFFGLFKNWMLHYVSNLGVYGGEAVLRGNWSPLLYGQMGTWSVAGTGGIAGYGAINGVNSFFTDEDLQTSLYDWWGYGDEAEDILGIPKEAQTGAADFVFYGLPSLLNLSMQSRASVPGSDTARDISQIFNTVHMDRLVAGGEFIGNAVLTARTTGNHPANDPDTWNAFVRFAMPRTVQRGLQSAEDSAIRSLRTGNTLIDGLSTREKWMHALGVSPLQVQKSYDLAGILFAEQESLRAEISKFGTTIADARLAGDWTEVGALYRRAFLHGLPMDSVMKSADAFQQKREEPLLEREQGALEAFIQRQRFGLNR